MADRAKQTVKTKDQDFMTKFEVFEQNHTASWTRDDDGAATFEMQMHKRAGWLSLVMSESSAKSTRQTMLTLTPESARALYEFLKQRFESAS